MLRWKNILFYSDTVKSFQYSLAFLLWIKRVNLSKEDLSIYMDEVGREAGHSPENVKLLFSRNCQN